MYSVCIFLWNVPTVAVVNVQLLQVKSVVIPLKKVTIPRFELIGAIYGAILLK